jgi:hypothetical protein
MEKTNKILLNKTRTFDSVNVDSQIQFGIDSNNKPIPLNDIDTNVSQFEQFEKERKASTIYRFYGNVTPIISNPLFNDNIKINGNTLPITSKKIFSSDIFEEDGWIGFYNDELDETALQFNDNKSALCEFIPFDPGFDRLRILDSDGIPNYLFKITYPFRNKDITLIKDGNSLKDGIPIIEKFGIKLNGRKYVGFKTPINHGLSANDEIIMFNFIDNTPNQTLSLTENTYRVFKLGNQTNDKKFRTFIIDIDPPDIDSIIGVSTIKRVVLDKSSNYYVREFKSLTTASTGATGGAYYKDYDIYPAAFGTSYYNDKVASFNFKTDIDVDGLVDNLNRPLSELYFTIIKNDSDANPTSINSQYWIEQQDGLPSEIKDRFWTRIIAGYETENNENINYNVRAFGDPTYNTNTWYSNIDESDDIFDGDIVEYNESELLERRLELIHHRVNTIYREHLNEIDSNSNTDDPDGNNISVFENKREGYIYRPFNKIQIREFANYINPVVDIQSIIDQYNITNQIAIDQLKKSFGVPDYATEVGGSGTNIYKWRDLLEIGSIDTTGGGVDYPFESGAHYININKRFFFQRQDPPCEFVIVTEEVTLGAGEPPENEDKFLSFLSDPTFLNYSLSNATILNNSGGVSNLDDLINYNGTPPIEININLADFVGEYELGKRDIAGGCVDLSLLKQKDIDDVC